MAHRLAVDPQVRVFHPQSGIATLDEARYSAPVLPVEQVELLRDGLTMAVIPAQPEAQMVAASGAGADVIVRLLGPIRRLARDPAPDLRPRMPAPAHACAAGRVADRHSRRPGNRLAPA